MGVLLAVWPLGPCLCVGTECEEGTGKVAQKSSGNGVHRAKKKIELEKVGLT